MPDHFDRLLNKGDPVRDRAGTGVRVRPRLPGPFERIETLGPARTPMTVGEEPVVPGRPPVPGPLPRPAPPATAPTGGTPRVAVGDHRPAAVPVLPLPRTPLLVAPPIAPAATAPAVEPPARTAAARPTAAPPVNAAPLTAPPRTAAPEPSAGAPSAAPRPAVAPSPGRLATAAASPGSTDGGRGRRRQRPVERVVRVQIGRVEVRAAERAPAAPRRPEASRPAPALALDRYLDREPS
ncbi:hypothetical protein [Kitasatospora sp. NPDC008115]|uniref:hypothetical protein n=1 Tax=Kitasatospora sp. NPDC008115 TaxID=3364022 RepID=UPI0036E41CC6